MPRDKVEIKKIENRASLQVTFSKRRKGLFKKAKELAVMCEAQVGVIVFSAASKLTNFADPSVDEIIEKWSTHPDTIEALKNPPLDLNVEEEFQRLSTKCDEEELIISQMEGEQLENLSIEELNKLEEMMHNGLARTKEKMRERLEETILRLQQIEEDENMKQEERKSVHQEMTLVHQESTSVHQEMVLVHQENTLVHQERTTPDSALSVNANNEESLDPSLHLRLGI